MTIGIWANDEQWIELDQPLENADLVRLRKPFTDLPVIHACLLLQEGAMAESAGFSCPVLINSVHTILGEMKATENIARINGWNGFLARKKWEVAGSSTEQFDEIFKALGKEMIKVPDEPGFVSARVIAMIINEAYFTLEDKISTREEIDIAMKLGTNYPYGPFEWASLIGIRNIYELLKALASRDNRYSPAPSLTAAATL